MSSQKLMVHLSPELRREIEVVASAEGRSLSNTARRVLDEWARRRHAEQPHGAEAA